MASGGFSNAKKPTYEEWEREIEALKKTVSDNDYMEDEEKEIEEKTQFGQTLLETLPCVAMLIRPGTREIVASNDEARKFGAFPGKICFETWGQRDEPCSFCLAPRVWETGEAQHMEVGLQDIIWDTHWFPIKENLYLYYGYDITEKRKLEARFQRSQKMESLGLMAGGIAHDLNNILSGIVSYPDLIFNGFTGRQHTPKAH